ncbi:hypothetical protein Salmuc_04457 [Salipiger mucosus DSM 16094]|uniref:Uncharacterized protein n=1 Tax=Salipiger mucosus DSM 16094 TaxID=1123237 RepID=S9QG70_9RHOB|nr:hypothetical protein Salmuc_04457 [Salipiger mucosus DSM 16094]
MGHLKISLSSATLARRMTDGAAMFRRLTTFPSRRRSGKPDAAASRPSRARPGTGVSGATIMFDPCQIVSLPRPGRHSKRRMELRARRYGLRPGTTPTGGTSNGRRRHSRP